MNIKKKVITDIICDCCGKTIKVNNNITDHNWISIYVDGIQYNICSPNCMLNFLVDNSIGDNKTCNIIGIKKEFVLKLLRSILII